MSRSSVSGALVEGLFDLATLWQAHFDTFRHIRQILTDSPVDFDVRYKMAAAIVAATKNLAICAPDLLTMSVCYYRDE